MKLSIAALAALAMLLSAAARDNDAFVARARDLGQWDGSPAATRQWFRSLMQPANSAVSCCGEADAFDADQFEIESYNYVAVVTDGKGALTNGARIALPNNKMKRDAGNPTGHGIIFIGPPGQVHCHVAPGGV